MRDRPFLTLRDTPQPYSEIVAERLRQDPAYRARVAALEDIRELEDQAAEAADPAERKRLQCLAEGLRCALDERKR